MDKYFLCFQVIDQIPQTLLGQDIGCVQLFMCKMEPAFWSAQTTTKSYNDFTFARSLKSNMNHWLYVVYKNLPDLNSLQNFGKRCHDKYPNCELLSLL